MDALDEAIERYEFWRIEKAAVWEAVKYDYYNPWYLRDPWRNQHL